MSAIACIFRLSLHLFSIPQGYHRFSQFHCLMMASQKKLQTCSSTHSKTKTLPSSRSEGNLCSYICIYRYIHYVCMYIYIYIYYTIILCNRIIVYIYMYMYHVFSLSLYAQRMAPILVVMLICTISPWITSIVAS